MFDLISPTGNALDNMAYNMFIYESERKENLRKLTDLILENAYFVSSWHDINELCNRMDYYAYCHISPQDISDVEKDHIETMVFERRGWL